jgi:SAM-dependent methyltransferase
MTTPIGKALRMIRREGIGGVARNLPRMARAAIESFRDRRLGIDSIGVIEVDELTRRDGRREHDANAVFYQPLSYAKFRRLMRAVPELELARHTFVDFGCGKGRALVLAADIGFGRAVGVEMFPSLCEAAEANRQRYAAKGGRAGVIEIVCDDATRFALPDGDLYCYFYNPFDASIMAKVLANIEAAITAKPRTVTIGYANPVWHEVFDASAMFELVDDCESSRTYRSLAQRDVAGTARARSGQESWSA